MLQVREAYIDATKGHIFSETDWYEPYTDDLGRLYREYVKEYGRCISKIYNDTAAGKPKAVGWVFQSRQEYDDARPDWPRERRTYVREVWVFYRHVPDEYLDISVKASGHYRAPRQ